MASPKTSTASFDLRHSQIAEDDVTRAVEGALRWAEGHMDDNGSIGYTDFVNALPLPHTPLWKEVMLSAGEAGSNPCALGAGHVPVATLHISAADTAAMALLLGQRRNNRHGLKASTREIEEALLRPFLVSLAKDIPVVLGTILKQPIQQKKKESNLATTDPLEAPAAVQPSDFRRSHSEKAKTAAQAAL